MGLRYSTKRLELDVRTGRPREGNARRVTLSVKVTEMERDALIARWGSAYIGLRKAVENLLSAEPPAAVRDDIIATYGAGGGNPKMMRDIEATLDGPAWVDESTEDASNVAVNIPEQVIRPSRHVHKPETLIDHEFEAGVKYETWACECGHVLPRRKAKP